MFVGSRIDVDGSDPVRSVFFFLLRPRELVPVWIRGEGVDFGETTIV
jgi:hypothetical protein